MEFEWDEAKRLANIRKHGIDFIDVAAVFDGDTVTVEDDRYDYGEQRFVTFGLLQGRVIAVVHTERSNRTRIISARKATNYEQRTYFEQFSN
ncbi:BrnT family toxin [Anabaena lutea]|uniref:BrnT family toxin n=1 Tax=Anabaena lutea FACHB-196 TaxID=2692881 RepID=A0ABR8FI74_9NOST|nr:BrnT family toxin [Anabaena lutea]MBD2568406.1 BrnT family toxin [Anabaena lutea FACHB-196]